MNPEWKAIITKAIEEAADEFDAVYECCGEIQYLDVDPKVRNSKFGSGSSGGCGAEVYSNHSYMVGSGNMPVYQPAYEAITAADDEMWKAAAKCYEEELKALGLDPDQITYNDVEEKDPDLVVAIEDAYTEQLFDENVNFRFGAFYYAPDNGSPHHPERGKHGIYVFGSIVLSGHYLGEKLLTYYEANFSFDTAEELEKKLTEHLTNIAREESNKP
jgi:hypothetical protein